jgi:hypothetical protein
MPTMHGGNFLNVSARANRLCRYRINTPISIEANDVKDVLADVDADRRQRWKKILGFGLHGCFSCAWPPHTLIAWVTPAAAQTYGRHEGEEIGPGELLRLVSGLRTCRLINCVVIQPGASQEGWCLELR